jgi:hypothetical protein
MPDEEDPAGIQHSEDGDADGSYPIDPPSSRRRRAPVLRNSSSLR